MPPPSQTDAAIALGSNLGDRAATIESAFAALASSPAIILLASGPVIETAAVAAPDFLAGSAEVGGITSRIDPGGPYLNSAALIRTTLTPLDLLARLQQIEQAHGRTRQPGRRWAPRTLDLDLILYGNQTLSLPGLAVPHPRLQERCFVLAPLAALAPGWIVPTLGKTVAQLLAELRPASGI